MALLFGGSTGGYFAASIVADVVYDPVYDTPYDASFIYQVLPSFYRDLMEDQDLFSTVWSGTMQGVAADMLNAWQIDYAKSLTDVPVIAQRKWVEFDLYKAVDFTEDPMLTRIGIPGVFAYDAGAEALSGTTSNRARHDRNVASLLGAVDERTSLAWDVELTVSAAQPLGSVIFGYFSSTETRLVSSIAVGVLGHDTLEGVPRPFIVHSDPALAGSGAVGSYALSLDVEYRLSATYTASSGVIELSVVELRNERATGTAGYVLDDLDSVFTNIFRDDSANFDTLAIAVGDTLIALGSEFEILSVDGSQLTVSPIGLAVDVDNVAYSIEGPVEVTTLSLDLPADSADPTFTADQFGVGSLDTRIISPTYVPAPGDARRKSLTFTADSWNYLDPTVEELILSLPRLQDVPTDPAVLLYEGTDYVVESSTLKFQEPPVVAYWAEYVGYDEGYIRDNFGLNVGLDEDSSDAYKAKVRGLYYAYFQGPTLAAIRTGVHILVGLPIAEAAGTVTSVNDAFSGTVGEITVDDVSYLYPSLVGTSLQVGDTVTQFEPLSDGVEIVDYLNDATWFASKLTFNEIQKYHAYQVNLNIDAFDISTLGLASTFVDRIAPTWKNAFFLVFKNLTDEIEMTDVVVVALALNLYDTPCDPPSVIAYDDFIYGGDPDWLYDMGLADWDTTAPAMAATGTTLVGYSTLTNGSATAAGTGTGYLGELGGPGAVVDRRLSIAVFRASATGETTVASHVFTDPSADFLEVGREVLFGDTVFITGEGTFTVLSIDSATQLTLDAPMTATGTVSYTITGDHSIWSNVATTASNTALDFATVFPGTTGTYELLLVHNSFFEAHYDHFEEVCPDEQLTFALTYTGVPVAPFNIDMPDTQTATVSVAFTGATGQEQTTTLTELTP